MSADRPSALSRRTMLGAGAALGVAAPLAGLSALPAAAASDDHGHHGGRYRTSVKAAVGFLQQVTDAYDKTGARIVQSFDDSRIADIGFIYDNALTTIALVSAGDVKRARQIGDGLLYAQNHDEKFTDGRLRQAYHANSFANDNGTAHFGWEYGLTGTAVGDMSWSGLALAQLARATRKKTYLDGAVRIGKWIFENTYSTTGLGGYTFGETAGLEDHKSTEHNIDVYGFFRLLAILTRDNAWNRRAQHAWEFVAAVWNSDDGFFWTGSDDGASINKNPLQLPLDVQTWYWLSIGKPRYGEALDWAKTNLATTDTPLRVNSALTGNYAVSGVGFSSGTFRTDVTTTVGGQSYTPKPDDMRSGLRAPVSWPWLSRPGARAATRPTRPSCSLSSGPPRPTSARARRSTARPPRAASSPRPHRWTPALGSTTPRTCTSPRPPGMSSPRPASTPTASTSGPGTRRPACS